MIGLLANLHVKECSDIVPSTSWVDVGTSWQLDFEETSTSHRYCILVEWRLHGHNSNHVAFLMITYFLYSISVSCFSVICITLLTVTILSCWSLLVVNHKLVEITTIMMVYWLPLFTVVGYRCPIEHTRSTFNMCDDDEGNDDEDCMEGTLCLLCVHVCCRVFVSFFLSLCFRAMEVPL